MISSKNKDLSETMTRSGDEQSASTYDASKVDGFQARMQELIRQVGSVAEVSRKCGIPESTIKKWADGISDPSRRRSLALARGTGVSLLWLLGGAGPMWAKDLTQLEQDTLTIVLGKPGSYEVIAAERRRDAAIKGFAAGIAAGVAEPPTGYPVDAPASQGFAKPSQDSRPHGAPMDVGLLTSAVRVTESVLQQRGIRDRVNADQFAELVRVMYNDMAQGRAEDAASQALARILSMPR